MPRHPSKSATTSTLSGSVFSDLVRKAHAMNRHVHPLHIGDTYREPIMEARAESQLTADHPRLHGYAPVQGEPVLLDAIQARLEKRHDLRLDRSQIQVTSGATGGLSVVCATILDPGDEVLLPSPYWPLIRGIIASRGAVPVEVPFYDLLGAPDFDIEGTLESAITERTSALYINSPNNPTGRVLQSEELDAIVAVANRHDLWVICDEAYEELWFGPERPEPLWKKEGLRSRAIATHTLSKSYGLAGARIGFLHGPEDVMRTIRGVQTFQTYCAARPMQFAAARALWLGDEWLREARQLYGEAAQRSADALGVKAPTGGTFLFFDASPHLKKGESLLGFLDRCLDAGVLLTPGGASGRDYGNWARLCFTSVPPDELDDALACLRVALSAS